jgi:CBS domain-containing protein
MTVAAILKHKGSEVAHVRPTATVAEVVQVLTERRIGAVLVLDSAGQVLGILSERDVVRSLAEQGARTMEMTAAQLMTTELHTSGPGTTLAEATAMMTVGRFRHLPVMDGDRLLGIVSIGDVVKARLSQQDSEVDSLKAYVAGVG